MGNVVAVWSDISSTLGANGYDASAGEWGQPEVLSAVGSLTAPGPLVATDGGGNAVAVSAQSDGFRSRIYANRYTTASGWDAGGVIDSPLGESLDESSPELGVNWDGVAFAVWIRTFAGGPALWANRFAP